jgi:hypothetical protein
MVLERLAVESCMLACVGVAVARRGAGGMHWPVVLLIQHGYGSGTVFFISVDLREVLVDLHWTMLHSSQLMYTRSIYCHCILADIGEHSS